LRVLKNAWFLRFARREKIKDIALKEAVARAEKGFVDADLGGGVIKQRIAGPGQGKSGGYRSIIIFRRGEMAFFVYGFTNSDRENPQPDETAAFKKAAKAFLLLSEGQLEALLKDGELTEVI
jgi:hypothetical protein